MMHLEIFGKNVKINIENKEIRDVLEKELSIYSKVKNDTTDVVINFVEQIPIENEPCSNSPAIHKTFRNGFLSYYRTSKVYFRIKNSLEIFIEIDNTKNFVKKFFGMGYRNNVDNVGQLLHELVLTPMIFFDKSKSLIHASSMKQLKSNKTILFGGTGGVGKTSLELLLCRDLGYSFISDDIAIVSKKKSIFPNLSFPKIYAYNVVDNSIIKKILFKNRTILDRIQWEFIRRYKGLSKVRRTIAPNEIFNSIESKSNTIDEYYILYKTNLVEQITFEKLDYKKASELTLDIIKTEYNTIFQHIIWHEYNTNLMQWNPIISLEELYKNWHDIYIDIFKDVNCYTVKIPLDIKHKDFLEQMKNKFKA